ncbi:MAG TPA: amidohydrolase family protein [Burkholderiaceae bacterium]|nr:amidohydrolase family protein [Burkholderiaceae bacterium]
MVIDAHVHCTGRERADDVLRSLDEAGIDMAVLLAPFLSEGYSLDDATSLRRGNEHLAQLVRGHEDRLVGFAVLDPRRPEAPSDLRRAVDLGLRGVKMVPTGWYPYDDAVQPLFATAHELDLPLLFHSGIFIDGRSGRFCRPTFFEALRDYPGLRVALAHLGWPWCDEAIAVGLIELIHGVAPDQVMFRFDISFGPPPAYRREILSKALDVLGPGLLQFGSDCFLPCAGSQFAERKGWVEALLDELGVDSRGRERIWSGTAAAWLGLSRGGVTPSRQKTTAPADSAAVHSASAPSQGGAQRHGQGLFGRSPGGRWAPVCC